MNYASRSVTPYIGCNAPSLKDVAEGRSSKRKAQSDKMSAWKKLSKGASSSVQLANLVVAASLLVIAL
jgi:hypothetical protein